MGVWLSLLKLTYGGIALLAYLHCPPATRDEASTAARDHPGRGEEVCAQNCLCLCEHMHVKMNAQVPDALGRI